MPGNKMFQGREETSGAGAGRNCQAAGSIAYMHPPGMQGAPPATNGRWDQILKVRCTMYLSERWASKGGGVSMW